MTLTGIKCRLLSSMLIFIVGCTTGLHRHDQGVKSRPETRTVIEPSSPEYPKHSVEHSYYQNGQLEYEVTYRNGKIDGIAKHWDENGRLISTVDYINGDIHGKWILYYPDGQILQSTDYFRGKKNGYERKYHPNGQLSSELQYRMDVKISDPVRWDSRGKLIH